MSGEPLPLVLPPGLNRDLSRYTAKQVWWDGNLVRWNEQGVMLPIGGWQKAVVPPMAATQPIRKMFSWRDNSFQAWVVFGTADKLYAMKLLEADTLYDITPVDLVWEPSDTAGFGSSAFGAGPFGIDSQNDVGSPTKFTDAIWSFDNWGEDLVAVHSGDGRLFVWNPGTPTTVAAPVANAPIGNRIVIVTNERHCMVLGGYGNPRKVKWSSRENLTDWTASPTNSAGGWELDTPGVIFGVCHVPNGILVMTDIDIYLVEYEGPPNYYGRRLMSDETGIVGPNAYAATPNGVLLLGPTAFWGFSNGLAKVECTLSSQIFGKMNTLRPNNIFMGVNEVNREVWTFFPGAEQIDANIALIYSYDGKPWWSKAVISRTAWLNPLWAEKPYAAAGLDIYQHETGWTADGDGRNVYAETGVLELNNGESNIRIDRVYPDTVTDNACGCLFGTPPYSLTFRLRQAPQAEERVKGPITLNSTKGYTVVRMRARQIAMRLQETLPQSWGLGTLRVRVKPGGKR